jgi:choline dehydrogenase-like flavoprotein
MIHDVRSLSEGSRLDADLCIVGAGPAGLTLAHALAATGRRILVLESGEQALNQGEHAGHPYAGLAATRHRGLGGTAGIWNTPVDGESGAKYVPLDPGDYRAPAEAPWSGWPFSADALAPYLARAQGVCALGPFRYDGPAWTTAATPPLDLGGTPLETRVYQFGSARPFTHHLPHALAGAENVSVVTHATALVLETDSRGARVTRLRAGTPDGPRYEVHARVFILAGGAVENARLLLLSGLGTAWTGRCFMEHPRDYSLVWVPRAPELLEEAGFYDLHRGADGTWIAGRRGWRRESNP